jgi:hypothetical protein
MLFAFAALSFFSYFLIYVDNDSSFIIASLQYTWLPEYLVNKRQKITLNIIILNLTLLIWIIYNLVFFCFDSFRSTADINIVGLNLLLLFWIKKTFNFYI